MVLSNNCILCLVLHVQNKEENTMVFIASFLSSNGRILAHFEQLHLELSTHAYLKLHFRSKFLKYENFKNRMLCNIQWDEFMVSRGSLFNIVKNEKIRVIFKLFVIQYIQLLVSKFNFSAELASSCIRKSCPSKDIFLETCVLLT